MAMSDVSLMPAYQDSTEHHDETGHQVDSGDLRNNTNLIKHFGFDFGFNRDCYSSQVAPNQTEGRTCGNNEWITPNSSLFSVHCIIHNGFPLGMDDKWRESVPKRKHSS